MEKELIYNFRRKEQKYLINDAQLALLKEVIAGEMEINEFGESRVVSVYYDNEDFELINRSVERPDYKEKLRVRAYDPDGSEGMTVFAEIKKKYDGVVYKRRVRGPYAEVQKMLAGGMAQADDTGTYLIPGEDPQIQKELQWMMQRYGLKPKVWISCTRLPYQARDGSDLRITFDSDLRYQTDEPDLCYEGPGEEIIPADMHIMEIKSSGGLPAWLCSTLSENRIFPQGFSKVGTAFENKIFQSIIQE